MSGGAAGSGEGQLAGRPCPPEPAHHAPAPSRATLANRQRRSSYMGWDKAGDPLARPGLLQSRAPPRGHEPARGGGLLAPCSECYWALQQTWQMVTEAGVWENHARALGAGGGRAVAGHRQGAAHFRGRGAQDPATCRLLALFTLGTESGRTFR